MLWEPSVHRHLSPKKIFITLFKVWFLKGLILQNVISQFASSIRSLTKHVASLQLVNITLLFCCSLRATDQGCDTGKEPLVMSQRARRCIIMTYCCREASYIVLAAQRALFWFWREFLPLHEWLCNETWLEVSWTGSLLFGFIFVIWHLST